jgi:hypothetical protein
VRISFKFLCDFLSFGLCLQDSAVIFFDCNILSVCAVALSRLARLFCRVISSRYHLLSARRLEGLLIRNFIVMFFVLQIDIRHWHCAV